MGEMLQRDNPVHNKENFVRIRALHETTSRDHKFLVTEVVLK